MNSAFNDKTFKGTLNNFTRIVMFDEITSWDNVVHSYNQTQKGAPRHKIPAIRFRMNETVNLKEIQQAVKSGEFKPKGFYLFEVTEPKVRIIHAPAYEDKIVHHMIYQRLRDFFEPKFIFDSYSCIRNKGNQKAVKRLQKFCQEVRSVHGDVWVYKLDVSKFFPSMKHSVLKDILKKHIEDVRTLHICNTIIDTGPHEDRGLPLGCVTSQLFANVYMNPLDHYMKRFAKAKHYLRYADDIFIITGSKQEAERLGELCHEYLTKRLELYCAPGKHYLKKVTNSGLDGLGYKIFSTHILLLSKAKIRTKRLFKRLYTQYKNNQKTLRQVNCALAAWTSHAKIANSYNFIQTLLKDFPWLSYQRGFLRASFT